MAHLLVWALLWTWVTAPLLGYLVGTWKGRPWAGFYLSLFLSLLGLALIIAIPSTGEAQLRHTQLRTGHGGHVSASQLWHEGPHQRGHHRRGGRHAR